MIEMIERTEETGQTETFCIDSDQRVEWLLRKLANLEAEKARVAAQARDILKSLDADADRLRYLFGDQLEAYCRAKLQQTGNRKKTVRFLQGSCAFRSVPAGLKITDPAAALCYARDMGFGIKTELDAATYREQAQRRLMESGEVLPGCESLPERESFTIQFGKLE